MILEPGNVEDAGSTGKWGGGFCAIFLNIRLRGGWKRQIQYVSPVISRGYFFTSGVLPYKEELAVIGVIK